MVASLLTEQIQDLAVTDLLDFELLSREVGEGDLVLHLVVDVQDLGLCKCGNCDMNPLVW